MDGILHSTEVRFKWRPSNCLLHSLMHFRLLLGAVETKVNRLIDLQRSIGLTEMCHVHSWRMC